MAGEIHQLSSSTVTDFVAPQNELLQTLGHWIQWWYSSSAYDIKIYQMSAWTSPVLPCLDLLTASNSLAAQPPAALHCIRSSGILSIWPEQRGKAKARLSAPWSPMKLPQQWLAILYPNMPRSYQPSGPVGQTWTNTCIFTLKHVESYLKASESQQKVTKHDRTADQQNPMASDSSFGQAAVKTQGFDTSDAWQRSS